MEQRTLNSGTPVSDKAMGAVVLVAAIAIKVISLCCYAAGYIFAFMCSLVSFTIMLPIYIFRFICGATVIYFGFMALLFIGKLVLLFLF